ncbi:MAG: helix-turn-helix domain-containing protein [Lachnospiraceae bacterium]|nr:helix-turn-helix domain-containing protein [Lachnospiraceae bacterium]
MDLPIQLKDTVPHGNSRYPFAVHETIAIAEDMLMLYLHWHEEAELLLALEGDVEVRINNDTFHMKEGEAAYIEPNALHACYKAQSDTCHLLALVFRPEVIAPAREPALYEAYLAPVKRGQVRFAAHLRKEVPWQEHVIRLVRSTMPYCTVPYDRSDLALRGILYEIWSELFLNADSDLQPAEASSRLAPALEYIYENYRFPITISDIAAQVNLSVSRFSTLFRKAFHTSPVSHLLYYRLHRCTILLLSTDLTVAEIAFSCGFDNLSNFNRQFRERIGSTPTAYRNKGREIREQQTMLQTERNRIFETFIPSSETENPTSYTP